MIGYPSAEDYILAVQQPDRSFLRPELRSAVFAVHPVLNIPMPASGSAAVVFRAAVGGGDRAVRCFTQGSSERAHYSDIGRHVVERGLTAQVAHASWNDDAIRVKGNSWPVVEMEWVEGRTLDAYVAHLIDEGDRRALGLLAVEWRLLIKRLQESEFAHGDLQHGNVLVDTSSDLRLVDLDGAWIPAFDGRRPPGETGHPNYQRRNRPWGRWMDTFPGLAVYTALMGLAKMPSPPSAEWIDDKIMFGEGDYEPPFATPAWRQLEAVRDEELAQALALLKRCCAPGWEATCSLEELLAGAPRPPVGPSVALPPTSPARERWWEIIDGAPAQAAPPAAAPAGAPAPGPKLPAPPVAPPPALQRAAHQPHLDPEWYVDPEVDTEDGQQSPGATAFLALLALNVTFFAVFFTLTAGAGASAAAAVVASIISGVIACIGVVIGKRR